MIYKLKTEKSYYGLNYNIELDKAKKVYCFIGENGVGKTKLLETMCNGLIYGHSLFTDKNDLINFINNVHIKDSLKNTRLPLPQIIKINDESIRDGNWGYFDFKNIDSKNKVKYSEILKFIGARNRGHNPNFDNERVKLLGSQIDRFSKNFKTTLDALKNEDLSTTGVADWFVSRIIGNTGLIVDGNKAHNELLHLCEILKDLDRKTFQNLISKNEKNGNSLSVYLNGGKLYFNHIPFESLPTGYMGILKIVQDIVDTYGSWDFKKVSDYSLNAIIFIDEIEAHLHPKWESKVIPLLKKFFPNAIFYITTHSPTIIGSTEEGEAYELVNNQGVVEAKKLGNPRSWYLADVYSQAFHLNDFLDQREEHKEETLDEFKKFSDLVKAYLKTKDKQLLIQGLESAKKLEKNLPKSDPRLITLNNLKSLLI